MDKIIITDDKKKQIEIGKELFQSKSKVYTDNIVSAIYDIINYIVQGDNYKGLSKEDIFYISIYDYWVVGNNVSEEFYYDFLSKTYEEKNKFLTMRSRSLYTNYLNDKEDAHLLDNKYEAYQFLKPFYKRDVIEIKDDNDYQVFLDFISKHPKFIVKPSAAALSVGVHKVDISDYSTPKEAFSQLLQEGIICEKKYNFCKLSSMVLEELMIQDPKIGILHPASINSIRCNTIRINNDIHFFYPCIKIGINNNFITSGALGCIIATIDPKTGIVNTEGRTETLHSYQYHPNTNIKIKDFKIPDWNQMLDIAKQAAEKFDRINFIGWDMVYTTKGWCIMEGNFAGEFVSGQMPSQRGLKEEFEQLIGWKPKQQFWWE